VNRRLWLIVSTAAVALATAAAWVWTDPGRGMIGRGNAAFAAGRLDEASRLYGAALEGSDPARARFNVGTVRDVQKRPVDAASEFARAVDGLEERDRPEAFYNLGTSLAHAGRLEDAVQALKQALRLRPDHERARYNLALVLEWLKARGNRSSPDRPPPDRRTDQPTPPDLADALADREREGWASLRRPPQPPRTPRVRDW
jgi:tetratricopeptide (TPR) repeat protein